VSCAHDPTGCAPRPDGRVEGLWYALEHEIPPGGEDRSSTLVMPSGTLLAVSKWGPKGHDALTRAVAVAVVNAWWDR
jgi:hypothetical protein